MGLKPGNIIIINGKECILDDGNIDAIKTWKALFNLGDYDEGVTEIGFSTTDHQEVAFAPSEVLKALDLQSKGRVMELNKPAETSWGAGDCSISDAD